ncbi:MAG: hypothetical protein ACFE0Q_18495 [Anaerolineae bacterium]
MYAIDWVMENRIVISRPVGDQTKESVTNAIFTLKERIEAGTAPVHVISDLRYVGAFPTDLSMLVKMIERQANSGYTIVIGGTRLTHFFSRVLAQFGGGRSPEFFDNVADALAWLQKVDATLGDDLHYDEAPPA